ncbi:hypothetical protein RTM1035_04425 [Roseovarius sp. TM1035]|nr:hypothetical protein RTM1035_04425 [Roseovarius sp. TM1035]
MAAAQPCGVRHCPSIAADARPRDWRAITKVIAGDHL